VKHIFNLGKIYVLQHIYFIAVRMLYKIALLIILYPVYTRKLDGSTALKAHVEHFLNQLLRVNGITVLILTRTLFCVIFRVISSW